jgi:hypothetical protein
MHEIVELDRAGLRRFGLVTGSIVAGLFGLLFPWLLGTGIPRWPWIVAGVLAVWALAAPDSLAPVYRNWMRLGLGLSRVTTPVVLGAVFFLVFLPVALVMRATGRDPMARRFDPSASSYRTPSHQAEREGLERPF